MKLARNLGAAFAAALLLAGCGQQDSAESEPTGPSEAAVEEKAPEDQTPPANQPAAGSASASEDAGEVPEHISSAVDSPDRPAEDTERDADRRPAQVLTFFGVEPGMTVLEFVAGGGYYTELLSRAVGESGHVYATRLEEERIAEDRLPNVTAVGDREWGLEPGSVDLVFTALNWHDLYNIEDLDRPDLLQRFHEVLKPGGTLAVIDHAAEEGSGDSDTDTLHRIDEQTVEAEITDAGFKLADRSDVLRHPEDDRTGQVFEEGLRGKTDRFVLKFVKPEAGE